MKKKTPDAIENNLGRLRQTRGFSAASLAKLTGVTRQSIHAMEMGSYVPNTLVALKLAQVLEVGVEDLFALPSSLPDSDRRLEQIMLLPESDSPHPGQPVQLCRVADRLIATRPSPFSWFFPASDGVVSGKAGGRSKTTVQVFDAHEAFGDRILIAGCDPGISVLARHVQSAGVELVLAHRNSSQALALLKQGCVHIAGTHVRDEASGESNVPEIARRFPKHSVAVVSFAIWEEGILTASGNSKGIKGIEDFARTDISIVNRDHGAGSRILLDSHLKRLGIESGRVKGYNNIAPGHLAAARLVELGEADCCIATSAAARAFGLGFIPLVSERYDLAMLRRDLGLPGIQTLLDVLSRASFRRALENLGGYDARAAGQQIL